MCWSDDDFVSRCLDICCNGGERDWPWILETLNETKDADLRDEVLLMREWFWHPYSVLVHCMSSFFKKQLLSGRSHFDQGPCYFVLKALPLMPLPPCVKGTTTPNFFPLRGRTDQNWSLKFVDQSVKSTGRGIRCMHIDLSSVSSVLMQCAVAMMLSPSFDVRTLFSCQTSQRLRSAAGELGCSGAL